MNKRRRKHSGLSFLAMTLLVMCAICGVASGVSYAMIKNRQLQVSRDIAKAQGRIGDYQMDIDTEEMRIAALTDRYALRSSLQRIESQLEDVSPTMVEVINLTRDREPVALTLLQ